MVCWAALGGNLVAVVGSLWLILGGGLVVGVSFWFGCVWGWF